MSFLDPTILKGDHVVLEPLGHEHHDGLVEAVRDGELWKLWYTVIPTPEGMRAEIERRLGEQRAGTMLPFVTRRASTGEVLGMTTFCDADAASPRVEIGATWLARSAQGSAVNTEAKLLMLAHAFEAWGCIAVEFRTHWMNQQSRAAIARLGAKQDGILRSHKIMPDGTLRDTVVFSIIAAEWPTVRTHLQHRLTRSAG
ncbi:RimJ/RimL family protein N-acetyltransferase [Kineococcus xinjiangensis]|uniref:RimJ/RimL family protein N-acetyltransferase n=1 Tax=Kineococcus xinjiangensis TaxID=512762 RepID=A0A2S6IH57_9ACTN|nr:GNAT family protein [Kineococcus xinjiangensis]PPK93537.1 RimJ/RimL family protein N-acetyltransferase [Kineococcus xinjiangensis]